MNWIDIELELPQANEQCLWAEDGEGDVLGVYALEEMPDDCFVNDSTALFTARRFIRISDLLKLATVTKESYARMQAIYAGESDDE